MDSICCKPILLKFLILTHLKSLKCFLKILPIEKSRIEYVLKFASTNIVLKVVISRSIWEKGKDVYLKYVWTSQNFRTWQKLYHFLSVISERFRWMGSNSIERKAKFSLKIESIDEKRNLFCIVLSGSSSNFSIWVIKQACINYDRH